MTRVVCWFSCGAASAVAAKLAVERYGDRAEVVYCDTSKSEHPDNARFLSDVERWIGRTVTVIRSEEYDSVDAIFDHPKASYMSGIKGAPCTGELKKKPRFQYQYPDDTHVFGYTADESKRRDEFVQHNPELYLDWILIDRGITKQHCLEILMRAGIRLPAMYLLGYSNNNCLGCVKATSPAYWNKIRQDFPDVFARRAEQSRRIGCRLVRIDGDRRFLDELDTKDNTEVNEDLSCGPQCSFQGMEP